MIFNYNIFAMKQRKFSGLLLLLLVALLGDCGNRTGSDEIVLEVDPAGYLSKDVPVYADVSLPSGLRDMPADRITVTLRSAGGEYRGIPGQLTDTGNGNHRLWWVLPETSPDHPLRWHATLAVDGERFVPSFRWEDAPGEHADLLFGDRRVLRYIYKLDEHFKKGEHLSAWNKVFYHVYDLKGDQVITNGPEEGLWSHQRGIMAGWRDVGFRGQELSFWGMEDLTVQKHIEFLEVTAGPVMALLRTLVHWNDSNGITVVEEERQVVIYRKPPPVILLLDFSSTLRAVNGPVILDGNAEHGGVQYRAHNDVNQGAPGSGKPEYHFHRDGIDPHEDYDLPWVGMSYGLRNKTYSVLDMDHPGNPDPTIWSAYRSYGRFGPFFRKELDTNESLTIKYRFWISEDLMPDRSVLSLKYEAYRNPPGTHIIEK